ncbi:ankyrin repeat and fibronectin type-III domain-containing protein 1-like isoform X3 [Ruditapes philippinarum]|uniref:ankyrin repeat and fibronectin type-III domain-containing protein 1-like isoform X3 n=1 Tax=Ruditapes philippinarum TaxID=129788 RepID=UPI00295A75E9|nr:ankyrin repeat and fibronectin type-III domain-containing protein 1-like isoform X3 [Ruditapes philippinarum]
MFFRHSRTSKRPNSHLASDPSSLQNSRQRSVSLDCGDGRMMKMFTSESDNLQQIQTQNRQILRASPSDPGSLLRANGYPSPGRPPKTPLSTPKKRTSISSTDTDSSSPGKVDRKRMSKEARTYDILALFDAVEHQDLDAVKDILETNGIDINSVNSEFLTPLDVAVMTNNIPMAKMLLTHGARESPLFQKGEGRSARLDVLVSEAERRVVDLTAAVLNGSSGNTAMSSNQQKENERQLSHWEFRHRLLKRMKAGYDHARCPDPPTNVTLNISSSTSLLVKFGEPLNRNGAVVTKYKVEWSKDDSFARVEGDIILDDVRYLEVEIKHLKKGTPYYVRVSAMNMKGFSGPASSNPLYAIPSSWRDVDKMQPRWHGKLKILEELFTQVKTLRPADAPTIKDTPGSTSPVRKKKGFKNLFSSAPKFHKGLKRGVYLACYFRYDDKVLVTSEEQIPIVEVDETFAGPSLYLDLYWLMKVACTWEDVKSLRQDMERSTAEGKVHFRGKLLQAVSVLQTALGTHDLGKFYFKPLRDPNGSIVLATVNFIRDPKVVSFNSGKWVPLSRLQRRQSQNLSDFSEEQECIVSSVNEMTVYHQTSSVPLRPGLYLGYLKLHASVDLIRVLVTQAAPNVLPNVKVRDCSNISVEEWKWLKSLSPDVQKSSAMSTNQQTFHTCLSKASEKLFKMLGISEEMSLSYRLYDVEVIELSPQVSFLLMLPPADDLCIVPGQNDEIVERDDFTLLPVQVFEMIHMSTYQPQFISRYSRLSSILEMDTILAQQMQREAFSKEELNTAKDRVKRLLNLQNDLDKAWKGMRWIMDIITHARSRTFVGCIPVQTLYSASADNSLSNDLERKGKIRDNNNYEGYSSSCNSNEISVGKDHVKIAKFYDPNDDESQKSHKETKSETPSHNDNSGILRVYAAYDTGLAKGTSVKLHVTPRTTAREVINLVVLNLNQAVINKGKSGPVYEEEKFTEFCLVAVIGARERILRDDYQPLNLQNPWTKGRLYVRMRSNLLAAIQQGQATAV